MAKNPFDQFDAAPAAGGANPFDQFEDAAPAPTIVERRPVQPQQEHTFGERLMLSLPKGVQDWFSSPTVAGVNIGAGSAAHGLAMGAADPVVGAAQLATGGRVSAINQAIDRKSAEYEAARAGIGREGFDAARTVGNIASPANLAIGASLPVKAVTTGGRIVQGARAGAAGAALAPVTGADESFVPEKIGQTIIGAAAGGAMTPVLGKTGDALVRRFARDPAGMAQQADDIMRDGLARLRQEGVELDQANVARLREQVMASLRQGRQVDPAAVARAADFDALNVQPLQGQITRDPAQFAREKNLRGVAGVGEPLQQRMSAQERRLQELLGHDANHAAGYVDAGRRIMDSLRQVDDAANERVGAAYAAARDHLGRATPVNSGAFSQRANARLDEEMLGSSLPDEARNILNRITTGDIPFHVNSLVLIDRRLSALQRDAARQGNGSAATAIGVLRDELNAAPIADDAGEAAKAAFDAARGLARQRFQTHETIPALRAAAEGDVAADDFVRRFLVNGRQDDLRGLARVLPDDARQEVRRQFAAVMQRAAYGENPAGDSAFSPSRYNSTLRQLRPKLEAFFSGDELAQFDRVGRVGGYINSTPATATVNTSNSAAEIMNLLGRIPGVPSAVGLLNTARSAIGNQAAVRSAMQAQPPQTRTNLTPKQLELLARTLGGGAAGVAGSAGAGVGD